MLVKMTSDLDLLGQFARGKSQDAFTALVQRHLNLVYSAALRQVRSPQLAEEVAQSVFADLAKVAATPSSPKILTPWLYAVTRRTAEEGSSLTLHPPHARAGRSDMAHPGRPTAPARPYVVQIATSVYRSGDS